MQHGIHEHVGIVERMRPIGFSRAWLFVGALALASCLYQLPFAVGSLPAGWVSCPRGYTGEARVVTSGVGVWAPSSIHAGSGYWHLESQADGAGAWTQLGSSRAYNQSVLFNEIARGCSEFLTVRANGPLGVEVLAIIDVGSRLEHENFHGQCPGTPVDPLPPEGPFCVPGSWQITESCTNTWASAEGVITWKVRVQCNAEGSAYNGAMQIRVRPEGKLDCPNCPDPVDAATVAPYNSWRVMEVCATDMSRWVTRSRCGDDGYRYYERNPEPCPVGIDAEGADGGAGTILLTDDLLSQLEAGLIIGSEMNWTAGYTFNTNNVAVPVDGVDPEFERSVDPFARNVENAAQVDGTYNVGNLEDLATAVEQGVGRAMGGVAFGSGAPASEAVFGAQGLAFDANPAPFGVLPALGLPGNPATSIPSLGAPVLPVLGASTPVLNLGTFTFPIFGEVELAYNWNAVLSDVTIGAARAVFLAMLAVGVWFTAVSIIRQGVA